MASRRRGLRAVDDPAEAPAKSTKSPGPAPRERNAAPAKPQQSERGKRITIYAEANEDDRRALTITAAMLHAEKGDVVRALVREFTSDSPNSKQLDQLREMIAKHA
jgi:hypothetical protein